MQINDVLHGFRITNVRYSEELKGTLYEMEHLKTGALLAWMKNEEENLLFSVAFKTIPRDDTGVFHILEHSVLEGSDRYPLKEPFLDLLKSSMNTFLNAMTFQDKTMYPVSSKNEKDFINLTRVYLDAVFHPLIYKNECIFRQEGWHYEFEEGAPYYNGVVFNEMKGALSSKDRLANTALMRALFPDNTYHCVSGGDPEAIPNLTYEDFLKAHAEFYSPSNARFWLDGDLPIDKVLCIIDEEYLSGFERNDKDHEIPLQQPIARTEIRETYAAGPEEDGQGKSYVGFAKVFADWSQRKRITAYQLMASYLAGDNEAPLKRAILEKGLAGDMEFQVEDGILQAFYAVIFKQTDPEKKAQILDTYRDVLQGVLRDGIDRDILTGCLNRYAFSLRDNHEPQGLIRNIVALQSWLYGGDILTYLESDALLSDLRADMDTDYYANILRELLDTDGTAFLTLLPSKTKGEEAAAKEAQRCAAEIASFTEEELNAKKELYTALRTWQNTPDSEETIAKLPTLELTDVSPEPQWTDTETLDVNGVQLLYHPVFTNGISHVNLHFSLADLTEEELQLASAMTGVMGKLPTAHHSAKELQKTVKKTIGVLDYSVTAFGFTGFTDRVKPYFKVNFSLLEENLKAGLELIREILTETDYSAKSIISENLMQGKEIMYQNVMASGNAYASRRVLSRCDASAKVNELTGGLTYLLWLRETADGFDAKFDGFRAKAEALAKRIFVSSRLMISETATERHPILDAFADGLAKGTPAPAYMTFEFPQNAVKEAVTIPAGVSYAALGGNIANYGLRHNGLFQTLSNILSFGYLWTKIRVQGGAYGCRFMTDPAGNLAFSSFRDPQPVNSIQVYRQAGDFIREFAGSDENLTNYIISGIAAMDGLKSPSRKGMEADQLFLMGRTREDLKTLRTEMLAATKEALAAVAPAFDSLGQDGSCCIIGNADALKDLDESWTKTSL